jgi:hypothetical protein
VEGRKQQELTDEQTFILESLYGGPAKGDAKENAAEAEVQRLAQYGKQIEKALEQHKEAAKKLDSAGEGGGNDSTGSKDEQDELRNEGYGAAVVKGVEGRS